MKNKIQKGLLFFYTYFPYLILLSIVVMFAYIAFSKCMLSDANPPISAVEFDEIYHTGKIREFVFVCAVASIFLLPVWLSTTILLRIVFKTKLSITPAIVYAAGFLFYNTGMAASYWFWG